MPNITADLYDGKITSLKWNRPVDERVTFDVEDNLATVVSINTDEPEYLQKAINDILSTEYVNEVELFDEEVRFTREIQK